MIGAVTPHSLIGDPKALLPLRPVPFASREVVRIPDERLVPDFSKAPGFIEYYVVDAGGGVGATISVFETQAQADESSKRAADLVRKHLAPLVPTPPQVTVGEVRLRKTK